MTGAFSPCLLYPFNHNSSMLTFHTEDTSMNPFGSLPTANANKPEDRLPGFELPPTDIYAFTIKAAYMQSTVKGGKSITYLLKDAQGKDFSHTVYPTSAKSGTEKPTYTDNAGNEQYLAGYIIADDIAVICTGNPLGALATTETVFDIMDTKQKKKVPTKVLSFPELNDRKICLAIERSIENRQRMNESTKQYETIAETRQVQELIKALNADQYTVNEVAAQAESPAWATAWLKSFKGKDRNKTKSVAASGVVSGLPTSETTPTTPNVDISFVD